MVGSPRVVWSGARHHGGRLQCLVISGVWCAALGQQCPPQSRFGMCDSRSGVRLCQQPLVPCSLWLSCCKWSRSRCQELATLVSQLAPPHAQVQQSTCRPVLILPLLHLCHLPALPAGASGNGVTPCAPCSTGEVSLIGGTCQACSAGTNPGAGECHLIIGMALQRFAQQACSAA